MALKFLGRERGHGLVASLGLTGVKPAPEAIVAALNAAVGLDGTRLYTVESVENCADGSFVVNLSETICSAGELPGSERQLTFTLIRTTPREDAPRASVLPRGRSSTAARNGPRPAVERTHGTFGATPTVPRSAGSKNVA